MIYVNENRMTGDKKVIRTMKKEEVQSMKSTKNAIILTGQLMENQQFYITTVENHLAAQQKYCEDNNIHVHTTLVIPRFTLDFTFWIDDFTKLVDAARIKCVVLHTKEFENHLFSYSMMFTLAESLGLEIIDESDYVDDFGFGPKIEPDALMVAYLPELKYNISNEALVEARYNFALQRDLLKASAEYEHYILDPIVFVGTQQSNLDEFFDLIEIYLKIRRIQCLIVIGDEPDNFDFVKELVDHFSCDDIPVVTARSHLETINDKMDYEAYLNTLDDEDELPFN